MAANEHLTSLHTLMFEPHRKDGRPAAKVGEFDVDGLRILNLGWLSGQVGDHGVPMHGAPATGLPLHSNGHLGADLVHVAAGEQFPVHTHPGDHLLLSIGGLGTITVADVTYSVRPGDIYMVDGAVPHAVGADPASEHLLVAIGAPHKAVDSPERMTYTDWFGNAVDAPMLPSSVTEHETITEAGDRLARESLAAAQGAVDAYCAGDGPCCDPEAASLECSRAGCDCAT